MMGKLSTKNLNKPMSSSVFGREEVLYHKKGFRNLFKHVEEISAPKFMLKVLDDAKRVHFSNEELYFADVVYIEVVDSHGRMTDGKLRKVSFENLDLSSCEKSVGSDGVERFAIDISTFTIVPESKAAQNENVKLEAKASDVKQGVENFDSLDVPLGNMTILDFIAIQFRMPISKRPDINSLINKLSNSE